MTRINPVVYRKLLLQADEAKLRGMNKLASAVLGSIGACPAEEKQTYNFESLQEDIHQGLWKLAMDVIRYHDLESADIEKIDEVLETLASTLIEDVEVSLNVAVDQIGALEEIVPGEE